MPRPTIVGLQTTISMLRSEKHQNEVIAAKHRADLEHVRLVNEKLGKENMGQRQLIQNLIEIMQRSVIKER